MPEVGMTEIVGNAKIEDAAIKWVLDFEASQNRQAQDARFGGHPTDVVSTGRIIEVKAYGRSARGSDLWLEARQVEEARKNPGSFHVYVVENVRQGNPAKITMRDILGSQLASLLDRAKEQRYFTVSFPVAVYDSLVQATNPWGAVP